jgi:hypothetical protein
MVLLYPEFGKPERERRCNCINHAGWRALAGPQVDWYGSPLLVSSHHDEPTQTIIRTLPADSGIKIRCQRFLPDVQN